MRLSTSVAASIVYAVAHAVSAQTPTLHGTLVAANMNDNTATVLDLATQRTVVTLPTGLAPHEVAISHNGHWAVVSNYGPRTQPGNSLTVIDLSATVPAITRTIDLGQYHRPHGSAFLPGDSTLLVTVEANQSVLVVNISSGTVSAVHVGRLAAPGAALEHEAQGQGNHVHAVAVELICGGVGAEVFDLAENGHSAQASSSAAA